MNLLMVLVLSHLQVYAGNTTLGKRILEIHGLNFPSYFYWISLAALFGFALLFNIGFVLALTYFKCKSILTNN